MYCILLYMDECPRCRGIHVKMTQWPFLVEMSLVKDALETLQALTLFLQRRDATAVSANSELNVALRTQRSMRQADGVNAKCMNDEFELFHTFKGVKVSQPSEWRPSKGRGISWTIFRFPGQQHWAQAGWQRNYFCCSCSKSTKLAIRWRRAHPIWGWQNSQETQDSCCWGHIKSHTPQGIPRI